MEGPSGEVTTSAAPDSDAAGGPPSSAVEPPGEPPTSEALSLASVALSALGFLTLLRLADRRDRSPAKALGLFLATTLESTTGTVLGVRAVARHREEDGLSRGLLMGAAGTVLGVITTLLNVNWMRTRRRL